MLEYLHRFLRFYFSVSYFEACLIIFPNVSRLIKNYTLRVVFSTLFSMLGMWWDTLCRVWYITYMFLPADKCLEPNYYNIALSVKPKKNEWNLTVNLQKLLNVLSLSFQAKVLSTLYALEISKLSFIFTFRPTIHTQIRHENSAFRKYSSTQRNMYNAGFSYLCEQKTFWKRSFSKTMTSR